VSKTERKVCLIMMTSTTLDAAVRFYGSLTQIRGCN
jgi:hypothetical protein